MPKSAWIAIAIAASALAAVAVWAARLGLVPSPAPPEVGAGPESPQPVSPLALAELHQLLAAEQQARLELALELDLLREQVAALAVGAESAAPPASAEPDPLAAPEPAPDARAAEAAAEPASGTARPPIPPSFDEQALASLGLPEREVERLKQAWDAKEMELLYLRDQARREGWLRKPRFAHQSELVETELRVALGDDDYDRALYASGRPNRVRVGRVLSASPAEAARIQPGDLIRSVDGVAIFDSRELPRQLSRLPLGTRVMLEVERSDGSVDKVPIQAGPLGVELVPGKGTPER